MIDLPETEQVLTDFRRWIDQIRDEIHSPDQSSTVDHAAVANPVGLYQIVQQFVPLRHEIKLLTKALRGNDERHQASLDSMQSTLDQFHATGKKLESFIASGSPLVASTSQFDDQRRALVEGLVDLDESLVRGRRTLENSRRQTLADAGKGSKELFEKFEQLYRSQPWWRRALCSPWHALLKDLVSDGQTNPIREFFDSFLQGYELIQNRLQRTFDANQIIRMTCVGRQFDPNCMTVIEAIADPGLPSGQVVEETRLGYYWMTEVIRFAEVKVIGEK